MIEEITPSEDYLNEWYNTRAWATLVLREFRGSVDIGSNDWQDFQAINAVKAFDSLRNLNTPNGSTQNDYQTVIKYYKFLTERGEKIPRSIQAYIDKALFSTLDEKEEDSLGNKHIKKGKSFEVAFGLKGEVSGGKGLDKTNPPEYIFQLTDAILNKGISLLQASKQVATKQVKPSQKHMYKMFMEEEEWRLQGYVNWRFYRDINSGKTKDLSDLNNKQNKYLNEYWGKWLFRD